MLVLSRKKNESIIINDNITVTVIEIRGDKVRLGIEAPKDVTVHRREVYEAIHGQNPTTPRPSTATPAPSSPPPSRTDSGVS
jgi:carbon storage regulator